ncbi:hypothetical protein CDAR_238601 [Caerostris darwini]|uniref:Uncharacterized protein n=1 Tax=Caerostris darwini TaxID=1538125 RepID=A0AAV4RPA6_9ARAC|nr:hypothetical protein CDAR_238601 [Caerostris darwini]
MQGPPPVFPERDGLSMIYSNINSETRRPSVIGRFREGGTHASGNCFATSLGDPPPVFLEWAGLSMIYSNIHSETRRQAVIGRFKEGGTDYLSKVLTIYQK